MAASLSGNIDVNKHSHHSLTLGNIVVIEYGSHSQGTFI